MAIPPRLGRRSALFESIRRSCRIARRQGPLASRLTARPPAASACSVLMRRRKVIAGLGWSCGGVAAPA